MSRNNNYEEDEIVEIIDDDDDEVLNAILAQSLAESLEQPNKQQEIEAIEAEIYRQMRQNSAQNNIRVQNEVPSSSKIPPYRVPPSYSGVKRPYEQSSLMASSSMQRPIQQSSLMASSSMQRPIERSSSSSMQRPIQQSSLMASSSTLRIPIESQMPSSSAYSPALSKPCMETKVTKFIDTFKMPRPLYFWQKKFFPTIVGIPENPPNVLEANSRKIIWIWGSKHTGKTQLGKELYALYEFVRTDFGNSNDIARAVVNWYNTYKVPKKPKTKKEKDDYEKLTYQQKLYYNALDIKGYVLNLAKEVDVKNVPYQFLEGLKDKSITSLKYDSTTYNLIGDAHIIITSNYPPDILGGNMSLDRWEVWHILDDSSEKAKKSVEVKTYDEDDVTGVITVNVHKMSLNEDVIDEYILE